MHVLYNNYACGLAVAVHRAGLQTSEHFLGKLLKKSLNW